MNKSGFFIALIESGRDIITFTCRANSKTLSNLSTPKLLLLLCQTGFTAASMVPSQNRRFTLTTHMTPLSVLGVAFATFVFGLCFVLL